MASLEPGVEAAWNTVVQQLEAGPPASELLMLEDPSKPGQTAECITTDFVLGLKHLLLPVTVAKEAHTLSTRIQETASDDLGGGGIGFSNTSNGNAVWLDFMLPKVEEAQEKIRRKQWRKAFGVLLGMQLFVCGEDGWIRDQEVYLDTEQFAGWFSDYSAAWVAVLGRGDRQLGLAVAKGKEGGYRGILKEILANWENQTNHLLREAFDQFADDDSRARVRIFSEDGSSDEDDDLGDEDDEDDDNDDDEEEDDEEEEAVEEVDK